MADTLRDAALDYHRYPTPGKISVNPTKAMAIQRDLALAYSPGVAEACLAIVDDAQQAAQLTSRANLVAVVTNGITVGGILLGAARPVHILAPSSTVRRIVNMTALAVVGHDQQRRGAR